MRFFEYGDYIISKWMPRENFQGYLNILHGGIQATLMDEIASWVVIAQLHSAGYTSKAEIRYHKTAFVNKGPITLRARSIGMRRNLADIEVRLLDATGMKCSSGLFTYFTYPENRVKAKMFS